ncbi:hypothetical protein Patl1_06663 [Pistacia atlantica]|uniref:Uncharacterized protein n=1 Tax=Pistacia atlantica TaxID=434234 RepID=A0ACC1BUK0_9ROSI|nr:hypothetical protein Patl1_06663 [Pistacia atlantica]
MWPEWLRSPSNSPSRVQNRSNSFSCSSFKDIQAILKEPEPQPRFPKAPSIFHRVRISTSVLRSWAHKNSIPSAHLFFRPPHQGIIVYFTSLHVVRKTYEDCRTVRSILRGFRVLIDERDLSMDSKFLDELHGIIGCNGKLNPTKSVYWREITSVGPKRSNGLMRAEISSILSVSCNWWGQPFVINVEG